MIRLLSVESDYPIFKEIAEHVKPNNWNPKAYKRWLFWKHINNELIEDDIFFYETEGYHENIEEFLHKSKFGFAEGYLNLKNEIKLCSWQALDDVFFHGPYVPGVAFKDRIKIKQEIFDNLGDTKNQITLNDGFVLFDYDKVKEIYVEKTDEKEHWHFKIKKGKVSYAGGLLYKKDVGGGGTFSIEYLYYNLDAIPRVFSYMTNYVKSILEKAIVNA